MIDLDQISDHAPPGMGKTVYLLRKMKDAGEPVVLAVNGRGNIAIEDDESYQLLIELVDRLETIEVLKERVKSFQDGEAGVSLEEVEAEARQRYGVSR